MTRNRDDDDPIDILTEMRWLAGVEARPETTPLVQGDDCLTPTELLMVVDGRPVPRAAEHLTTCEFCRRSLAAMRRAAEPSPELEPVERYDAPDRVAEWVLSGASVRKPKPIRHAVPRDGGRPAEPTRPEQDRPARSRTAEHWATVAAVLLAVGLVGGTAYRFWPSRYDIRAVGDEYAGVANLTGGQGTTQIFHSPGGTVYLPSKDRTWGVNFLAPARAQGDKVEVVLLVEPVVPPGRDLPPNPAVDYEFVDTNGSVCLDASGEPVRGTIRLRPAVDHSGKWVGQESIPIARVRGAGAAGFTARLVPSR